MKTTIKFEDAATWNALHPSTFELPNNTELKLLMPGDLVKVCSNSERFWVEITDINNGEITGKIDNDLIQDELKLGDVVTFRVNNIYKIYKH